MLKRFLLFLLNNPILFSTYFGIIVIVSVIVPLLGITYFLPVNNMFFFAVCYFIDWSFSLMFFKKKTPAFYNQYDAEVVNPKPMHFAIFNRLSICVLLDVMFSVSIFLGRQNYQQPYYYFIGSFIALFTVFTLFVNTSKYNLEPTYFITFSPIVLHKPIINFFLSYYQERNIALPFNVVNESMHSLISSEIQKNGYYKQIRLVGWLYLLVWLVNILFEHYVILLFISVLFTLAFMLRLFIVYDFISQNGGGGLLEKQSQKEKSNLFNFNNDKLVPTTTGNFVVRLVNKNIL